ncbi:MAG: hypothetical protein ABIG11_00140 [bacterium]
MCDFHSRADALATLAVAERKTSRHLIFDAAGRLKGYAVAPGKNVRWAGPPLKKGRRLGFNGIHVISPGIFGKLREKGIFSIIPAYLRLAEKGERIQAFPADNWYWKDMGSHQDLEAVRKYAAENGLPS